MTRCICPGKSLLIKLVPGGAHAMDLPAVWDVFPCVLSPHPEIVPQELKHGLKMFLLVTRLGDVHASGKSVASIVNKRNM